MGLSITAYGGLEPRHGGEELAELDPTLVFRFPHPHFPSHTTLTGLFAFTHTYAFEAGSYSSYSMWRNLLARFAGYSPSSEGGLPGYVNPYRDLYVDRYPHYASALAAQSGPFHLLLNFSDCEGTLGPETCQTLLREFREREEAAMKWSPDTEDQMSHPTWNGSWFKAKDQMSHPTWNGSWFKAKYQHWLAALTTATAHGPGAIVFH